MAKRNKGINIFRRVPQANNPVTNFELPHQVKFDGRFGLAYPIVCQEMLAGDTVHAEANHFSRLAPLVAPVLHEFDVRFHWFFVPMRLLWDDFEDWITGGKNGTWREENPDSFPLFELSEAVSTVGELRGSLFDFLGISTCYDGQPNSDNVEIASNIKLPVMPIKGYNLIYNYFFRDQNVTDELPISLASGLCTGHDFMDMFPSENEFGIFKVCWDKDYFTSASLMPQRGPQVYIPITGEAGFNVGQLENTVSVSTVVNAPQGKVGIASRYTGANQGKLVVDDGNDLDSNIFLTGGIDSSKLRVDLSQVEGAPVDDVREAFALQRFFERMQIVGSRFSEWLRGIWGTNAGDARLQMPEYLGTWTNPFMINNVSATVGTENNPQGGYSGNGMSSQYNKPITKYFSEPGYLYCLYIAMPRNGYQQGLAPIFCRKDWLDFANPYFEHIGEQPIKLEELYFNPSNTANNDKIFGYQSQYANYKFINSHSHGAFKQSLNFWHANRIFQSEPTLSSEFLAFQSDESVDRVFALPEESHFFTEISFKMSVDRQLSAFSTPRIM